MVKIIADTTAVLPHHIADKYHIPIIPQLIHFGDQTYIEGVDIDNQTFLEKLKTIDTLPKTAAPPPEFFTEQYKKLVTIGEPILCIHPSTDLSGTVRSASLAAQDFPEANIQVVDTRLVAGPLGVVVQKAAEWAESGKDIESIKNDVMDLSRQGKIFFLVATLDFLARGGRIGGASAFIGNALKLKPILTLDDGKVEPFGKERTMKRALNRLKELVLSRYPREGKGYMTIMHSDVPQKAKILSTYFQEHLGIQPPRISNLPPAIIAHAGPGALAVGFFETHG
ncbi:MAG: DegV family protein [Anaerolineales bacterium]|nr:DegV family protein [Anaerolineales bacterium]